MRKKSPHIRSIFHRIRLFFTSVNESHDTLDIKTQRLRFKFIKQFINKLCLYNSLFIILWIHASTDPPLSLTNDLTKTYKNLNALAINYFDYDSTRYRFGYFPRERTSFPNHQANDKWFYPSPPPFFEIAEPKYPPRPEIAPSPCIASITARHIEKGGIGYNQGYSTLEGLFFPNPSFARTWPFIDLRAHRFDDNTYAANAGLGLRTYSPEKRAFFGINTYFDYRTTHSNRLHFGQLGIGLELLTRALDIRANGYLPSQKRQIVQKCVFDKYVGGYFMIRKKIEVGLQGADLEVGGSLLDIRNAKLYAAAGPYYYADTCQNIVGGRLRMNLRLVKYLSFDAMMTYDAVYRAKVQGQIGLNFQLGCPAQKSRTQRNLIQPVQRNEILVIDHYCTWKTNF